jgi:hypothetical protein
MTRRRKDSGETAVSSISQYASSGSASAAGLRAQLVLYKKEYSACVNCSSAETLAGKANIQDLAGQIKTVETRLQQVQTTQPTAEATAPRSPIAALGNQLDVYA